MWASEIQEGLRRARRRPGGGWKNLEEPHKFEEEPPGSRKRLYGRCCWLALRSRPAATACSCDQLRLSIALADLSMYFTYGQSIVIT